ncbi:hypothetical protein IFM89_005757 [Coptis chinensis]|uniref:Uncharacterized protein n=1 Tax=Coptis chinensis TaxID=261450 RepID=A0A835IMB8_9MAGN|nr:hypothetical protein IFM89_005757 [Coptis chinensis]
MWIARNQRNPETIYGLEMLMIDEKFTVASTYGTYRQINNDLTIKFKDDTVVTATTDDDDGLFSKNKFTFTDLEHIPSKHGKGTYTIDVIGFLKGISPQGSRKYIEITIVNERGTELKAALWDDLSKHILSSISGKEDVVIILSSMFVKKFEGACSKYPGAGNKDIFELGYEIVEELRNR